MVVAGRSGGCLLPGAARCKTNCAPRSYLSSSHHQPTPPPPHPHPTPPHPAPHPQKNQGRVRYPVKAINVLKAHGKSAADSALLAGYALNMGRAAQGMPRRVVGAKIACLDMNLQKTRMQVRTDGHAWLRRTAMDVWRRIAAIFG
jgi:hypothetical protein